MDKSKTLSDAEREAIAYTMKTNPKLSAQAIAEILGISRATFYRRLRRHGLDRKGNPNV